MVHQRAGEKKYACAQAVLGEQNPACPRNYRRKDGRVVSAHVLWRARLILLALGRR